MAEGFTGYAAPGSALNQNTMNDSKLERNKMPEIRQYTVIRTQQLRVTATSPIDAARAADTVFKGDASLSDEDAQRGIRVRSPIRDLGFEVKEDC